MLENDLAADMAGSGQAVGFRNICELQPLGDRDTEFSSTCGGGDFREHACVLGAKDIGDRHAIAVIGAIGNPGNCGNNAAVSEHAEYPTSHRTAHGVDGLGEALVADAISRKSLTRQCLGFDEPLGTNGGDRDSSKLLDILHGD